MNIYGSLLRKLDINAIIENTDCKVDILAFQEKCDLVRIRDREYKAKHREELIAKNIEYQKKNRDKYREWQRRYRKKHRQKFNVYYRDYIARKKAELGEEYIIAQREYQRAYRARKKAEQLAAQQAEQTNTPNPSL